MIKARLITIALLLALLAVPITALASDISGAKFWGLITISNNSTATTNVATTANISTTNLINGNFLNSSANNCVMRNTSGADLFFMPGYNGPTDNYPWCMWVPSIGANAIQSFVLYLAESVGGLIRYFPDSAGMRVNDDASLEPGDNFTYSISARIDTSASMVGENITSKENAIRLYIGATENITARVRVAEDFSTYTEVDVPGKLTVTRTRAEGVDVDRDEIVYLYKDRGVNHFDALDVDFEIYIDSASLTNGRAGVAISNTVGTINGFAATDISVIILEAAGPVYKIYLTRGNDVDDDNYVCSADTPYYCTLTRVAGNDTVTTTIYSDAVRTVPLSTLSVAGFGATKYQYAYGFVNKNDGNVGWDFDGYVQNMVITGGTVIEASASGIASGEYDIEVSANVTHLRLLIDTVLQQSTPFLALIPDNSSNWTIGGLATPYIETANVTVDGVLVGSWAWEYSETFTDLSPYGNDATPSFRTASSDPDVSGELVSFQPISEAQAPDYALSDAPAFIDADALTGNITAPFTIVPPAPPAGFPLAGVIVAIANATGTPPQLPLLIIAVFVILAASLTMSTLIRRAGSGSLWPKVATIIAFMGFFIAIKNFGIDFWMLIVFLIIAVAIMFASRQASWS